MITIEVFVRVAANFSQLHSVAWEVALVAIVATRERIRAASMKAVVRLIRQRLREITAIVSAVLSLVWFLNTQGKSTLNWLIVEEAYRLAG